MKIETSRFVMEDLRPEEDVDAFAQISKKMAWKDTVEILLNEKKLEDHIRNIAQRDMEFGLSARIKMGSSFIRGRHSGVRINVRKKQNIFSALHQNYEYKQYIEQARAKVLQYRAQIINECKRLNIDIQKDKKIYEKINNKRLCPPIPISDWHYNIQFLKPNLKERGKSLEDDVWVAPVGKYINDGVEANRAKEQNIYYFRIQDKATGNCVGIARICSKPKEFIVNYEKDNPVTQVCVGDPGLFLDPSCQGSYMGSEIYATTLNVLYNFLLKEEDKKQQTIVKCNVLNSASRRLQYSIGASVTNADRPIDNRYYFAVCKESILRSNCMKKLETLGLDKYAITMDGITYDVSLKSGVLKKQKSNMALMLSMGNMMEKAKNARLDGKPKTIVSMPRYIAPQKVLTTK